jgi:hypothetical protein
MIPHLILSYTEFKEVVCCNLHIETYARAFVSYSFIMFVIYLIYLMYVEIEMFLDLILSKYSIQDIMFIFSFIFVISIYLIVTIFHAIFIKIKKLDNREKDIDFINQIAIIIPCHNSHDVIENTLKSVLQTFKPEAIYVSENNNSRRAPNHFTISICIKYNVNYNYFPIGNKGYALKMTLPKIDSKYKYIVTIDDDTLLGKNFNPDKSYFEDKKVSYISFGIKMKSIKTLAEEFANFEYIRNSINDYFKNRASTFFPVGIGCLWRREIFRKIINLNPTTVKTIFCKKIIDYEAPYAEDYFNGVINRFMGYKGVLDFNTFVESYAPPRFFYNLNELKCNNKNISGYNSLNHYKQRALRWYRSQLAKIPYELYLFFTYNCSSKNDSFFKKIYHNILYRLEFCWQTTLNYFAINIIYNSYYLLGNKMYGYWVAIHTGIFIFGILSNFIVNYITLRNRPDLQIRKKIIFLYPLFSTFVAFCGFIGAIGSLTYFIPFKSPFIYSFVYKIKDRYYEEENDSKMLIVGENTTTRSITLGDDTTRKSRTLGESTINEIEIVVDKGNIEFEYDEITDFEDQVAVINEYSSSYNISYEINDLKKMIDYIINEISEIKK